ncbi:MAG: hypothetical protein L3J05_03390 [Robiginitomaculum sp.]|nr:hypothetical protein [Robiginitomaculum sp.]
MTYAIKRKLVVLATAIALTSCASTDQVSSRQNAQINSSSTTVVESASASEADYSKAGIYKVSTSYDVWKDTKRGRAIDVKIYAPSSTAPVPVVIFSHGLGGSVEAAPYLGRHLASWGIMSIHIQHPGSDKEVWRGVKGRRAIRKALGAAARDPRNTLTRFNDIPFVLDQIEVRAKSGQLNANAKRVAIAGHSFGAHTVLALAGRRYPLAGRLNSFKDDRLLAGVVLSPPSPGARVKPSDYTNVYGAIDIPLLHITGTKDTNPLNPNDVPINRTIPFTQITKAPQYLIVFDGANHAVFGGTRPNSPAWFKDTQKRVAEAATTFLAAYLLADEDAQIYLDGPDFAARFNFEAEFQRR